MLKCDVKIRAFCQAARLLYLLNSLYRAPSGVEASFYEMRIKMAFVCHFYFSFILNSLFRVLPALIQSDFHFFMNSVYIRSSSNVVVLRNGVVLIAFAPANATNIYIFEIYN